jgi:hypothetical protein
LVQIQRLILTPIAATLNEVISKNPIQLIWPEYSGPMIPCNDLEIIYLHPSFFPKF